MQTKGKPSLRQLAKELGVSHNYLSQIINGKRPASEKITSQLGKVGLLALGGKQITRKSGKQSPKSGESESKKWYPQRNSNPCWRLEGPLSQAARRWGHNISSIPEIWHSDNFDQESSKRLKLKAESLRLRAYKLTSRNRRRQPGFFSPVPPRF